MSDQGQATHIFHTGEPLTLRLRVQAKRKVSDFVFGVGIYNAEGLCVYGTNTDIEEHESDSFSGDAEVRFEIEALDLVEGTYKLDVAVHKRDGAPYDYHRLLYTFRVKSRVEGRRHLSTAAPVGLHRRHHAPAESLGRDACACCLLKTPERSPPISANGDSASCSRTACSICCIRATCDISRPRATRATRSSSASTPIARSARTRARRGRSFLKHERAELLAALACVDAVVIFDEDTPADIIRRVQPDVLVKGADWAADQIVGRDTVEARGGKVVRIPVEQGWSTSNILEKIRATQTRR